MMERLMLRLALVLSHLENLWKPWRPAEELNLFCSYITFGHVIQVPYIDVKVTSTHVLPALVTLGSDQNLKVKYASIDAFGAVAQHCKNEMVLYYYTPKGYHISQFQTSSAFV